MAAGARAGARSGAGGGPRSPRAPVTRKDDGSQSEVVVGEGQVLSGNFHLATVVFRRALQLRAGARPRVDPGRHKLGHIAFLEVTAGAVPWEIGAL